MIPTTADCGPASRTLSSRPSRRRTTTTATWPTTTALRSSPRRRTPWRSASRSPTCSIRRRCSRCTSCTRCIPITTWWPPTNITSSSCGTPEATRAALVRVTAVKNDSRVASFTNLILTLIFFSDTDVVESPYSHMYGRVPLPTRGYIPAPRAMYIGEWD